MSTDTKLSIEADPSRDISVEQWDAIVREFDHITATLESLEIRLIRLEQLLPDSPH